MGEVTTFLEQAAVSSGQLFMGDFNYQADEGSNKEV